MLWAGAGTRVGFGEEGAARLRCRALEILRDNGDEVGIEGCFCTVRLFGRSTCSMLLWSLYSPRLLLLLVSVAVDFDIGDVSVHPPVISTGRGEGREGGGG